MYAMIILHLRDHLRRLGYAMIGLLGFASCAGLDPDPDSEGNGGLNGTGSRGSVINQMMTAYGVPTSEFRVSGRVTGAGGAKLKGIQVVSVFGEKTWMRTDTTYTDSYGQFSTVMRTYPADKVTIAFNDIDGKANGGEFVSQTVTVDVKQTGKGDGPWFQGVFEAQATVTLKRK